MRLLSQLRALTARFAGSSAGPPSDADWLLRIGDDTYRLVVNGQGLQALGASDPAVLALNADGGAVLIGGEPSGGTGIIVDSDGAVVVQGALVAVEDVDVLGTLRASTVDVDGSMSLSSGDLTVVSGSDIVMTSGSRIIRQGYDYAQAIVCTSSTRPSSPDSGRLIFETDTRRLLIYSSGAWVSAYGGEGQGSIRSNTTALSLPANAWTDLPFQTSQVTTPLVTWGSNTVATLNRAGTWAIQANWCGNRIDQAARVLVGGGWVQTLQAAPPDSGVADMRANQLQCMLHAGSSGSTVQIQLRSGTAATIGPDGTNTARCWVHIQYLGVL